MSGVGTTLLWPESLLWTETGPACPCVSLRVRGRRRGDSGKISLWKEVGWDMEGSHKVRPFGNLYLIVVERPALFSFRAKTVFAWPAGLCLPTQEILWPILIAGVGFHWEIR